MSLFPKWVSQIDRVSSRRNPVDLLAVFFVAALAISIFVCAGNSSYASDITVQKDIDLANADRKEKGTGELVENEKLREAAAAKVEDMITDDYFAHNAPDGTTPWHWVEKAGYEYNYAGENLAMDFVSAEKMNQAWLASPTHRANILNEKYKDIGVAVKEGIINGHDTIIVVQMFGSGDKNAPVAKEDASGKKEEKKAVEVSFPGFPLGNQGDKGDRGNKFILLDPIITSPQRGEVVSGKETEVYGRAKPGSKINLFDREKFIAGAAADEEGWFRMKISNLEEGDHVFGAESEIIANGKKETRTSGVNINFIVDATGPKIRYQLLANRPGNEAILKIFSNKPDCAFEVGESKIFSHSGALTLSFSRQNKLSVMIKARDLAGNKAFNEVNLAGYYYPGNSFDVISKFAAVIAPQKVFAARPNFWTESQGDSMTELVQKLGRGREAVRNNLGLAPHQFLSSRLTDEH